MTKKTRLLVILLSVVMTFALSFTGCKVPDAPQDDSADTETETNAGIDYMALVTKESSLPDGWEEALQITTITNSVGDEVKTESKAYDAYCALKEEVEKDLEGYEGGEVKLELDSAYRSVAEQQKIWDDFMEKYGEEYTTTHVAVPGYSEHQTGLALDLYFTIDGIDVYENEDLVQYPEIWEAIHSRLAEHGFILRYLPGKKDITGYAYEPWHIRYLDDPTVAKEIMDKNITFEEYLGKIPSHAATVDYGTSELYTQEEMDTAITEFKKEFENWLGCELHSVKYAGDECNSEENIAWLNSLREGKNYTQVIEFITDFHSPTEEELLEGTAWEADKEYTDYQWWLAREDGGAWELVSMGYE